MVRLLILSGFCFSAIGCSDHEDRYRPNGEPATKFEIRSASTKPIDGWQAVNLPQRPSEKYYLSPQANLSNSDIASTGVKKVEQPTEHWLVEVWLTQGGKEKLAKLTEQLVEPGSNKQPTKFLAILVDGKLVSAPLVREPVTSGYCQIDSGAYSEAEARKVAKGIVGP